jgi:hypothetical protein
MKISKGTSKYKGVYWQEPNKKWRARITINRKGQHIGLYTNENEAAKAYNEKALALFGTFARLNKVYEGDQYAKF